MLRWKIVLWVLLSLVYSYGDTISQKERFLTSDTSYHLYYCSSIGASHMDGSETYDSGFYASHQGRLNHFDKVLDLSGYAIDDCTIDHQGNLYWTDRIQKAIFKADIQQKHIIKIASGFDIPFGIALDEKHDRLYWINWLQKSSHKSGVIGYTDLATQKSTIVFQNRLRSGGKLTIYDDLLYISDLFGKKILKMDTNNHMLHTVAISKQPEQTTVASKYQRLIWCDIAMDAIISIGLNGYDRHLVINFKDIFANPIALIFDNELDKLLFIEPVANKGFGSTKIGGLHSVDIEGMHKQLLYSHPSLTYIKKLMIRK